MFETTQNLAIPGFISCAISKLLKLARAYLPHLVAGIGCLGVITSILLQKNTPTTSFKHEDVSCYSEKLDTNLTVYVSGAVDQPGVYTLISGSRVADALLKAGGVTSESDQLFLAKELNLAEILSDTQQIYIPFKGERLATTTSVITGTAVSDADSSKISINTASLNELTNLPKVGDKTAEKIVAGRPYAAVEELVDKKIISQSVFTEIKPLIRE